MHSRQSLSPGRVPGGPAPEHVGRTSRGWRRVIASGATAALIAGGALVGGALTSSAAAEPTVVSAVDFEDGTTGTWTQSGSPTLAVVESPDGADDGQVLSITRAADYEGIQSPTGIFTPGQTYDFTMRARLAADVAGTADVRFVGKPGYSWIGNTTISAAGWTTVSGSWTAPADATTDTLQAYIGSADLTAAYTLLVDDIVVTTTETSTGEGPAAGTVIADTDFDDQTLQGWVPRQPDDTAPTLAVVAGGADGTGYAAQVSDRDSDGDGLQYDVAAAGVSGATLQYEAWVRFADGEPAGEMTLSARTVNAGATAYSNLSSISGATNDGWTKVGGTFTMPAYDTAAELYFETKYNSGNVSTFQVDQVRVWVPEPAVVDTSLTPLKDTVDIPGMGVAIDSRETTGSPSDLLLHHFNQITAENSMKVEAWYDADRNFRINPDAVSLLDFAAANDVRVYGHVLLWHSQTPDWFFQREDGTALTSSEEDKQFLRDRLKTHIDNVAKAISDHSGLFGSDTNPMVAFDVVNEVVSDGNEPGDGLRRSAWYSVLGEEFIPLAFEYADEAFNQTYAAEGSDRPVKLFINDYNTEQSAKQDRYYALVERLLAAGVPVDGVGHQFHASLATPTSSLDAALTRFAALPVVQAVTELDNTVGTPVTEANLIKQGHWYQDAFNVFRSHADDLFSVTVWGLTDARSWRSEQAPVLFDGDLQAKQAYFGAAGLDVEPLLTAANVFGGSMDLSAGAAAVADDVAWRNLPAQQLTGGAGSFVPRWSAGTLTLLVTVASDTSDAVGVTLGDAEVSIAKDGAVTGDAQGVVIDDDGAGWRAAIQLPLAADVTAGSSAQLDVRVLADGTAVGGWNSPGATGTLTFLEDLSTVDVVEAAQAPEIDGQVDDAWADAEVVSTGKTVEGGADGATAQVRTLWSGDDTLYVLAEVTDPVVDVSSADPWNQDSVELFLDLGNTKPAAYGPNVSQMRISADNVTSFGTGDAAAQAARLTSATARTDTGYVVELAVTLRGQSGGQDDVALGGADTFQGLDVQVNDGRDGARYAVHTWADPTGTGYQTGARWGVAHLVAPAAPQYDAWVATQVYVAGDRVEVDGRVFEAQWWTQGQHPLVSGPWGSWMEVGAVVTVVDGEPVLAWTSSWVYPGGDVVAYDGSLWKAKWWTRNQAPGDVYGPWQKVGTV